jgi:ankyrin repeat protein
VRTGQRALAELLLRRGAFLNSHDPEGNPALVNGVIRGSSRMAELLLEKGAGVNERDSRGRRALMVGAGNGDAGLLRTLLKAGAVIDAQDADGRTPLMYAALIVGKPSPSPGDFDQGPAAIVTRTDDPLPSRSGRRRTLEALLDGGASLHARDIEGRTALHLALSRGHPGIAALLLARGAPVDVADREGRTPLMLAAASGLTGSVRALLARGADPRGRDRHGRTALVYARSAHASVSEQVARYIGKDQMILTRTQTPGPPSFAGSPGGTVPRRQ